MYAEWNEYIGKYSNDLSNDRGRQLLEFAAANDFSVSNTFFPHKKSRLTTWHSPDGKTHNQIDYILINKRFKSSINYSRTRTFPGADIGSDHDLLMANMKLRLKRLKAKERPRIKYNVQLLRDPNILAQYQASIGGKFAPLLLLEENAETLTEKFNEIVNDTAKEILGTHKKIKQKWVTPDIINLCDERRELKKAKNTEEGRKMYQKSNSSVRRRLREAKENWLNKKCEEIERLLETNNTAEAYSTVNELCNVKKTNRTGHIQDKNGTKLNEPDDILKRWTEYCEELYNYKCDKDESILSQNYNPTIDDDLPILASEVTNAIRQLKTRKAAGIDNIPGELIKEGGEAMNKMLHKICQRVWDEEHWPEPWTKSLVLPLPKKGNLELCQNYRTISLISHPSKILLRILLNRMKPKAEEVIAEEQAGFRKGRSTVEQLCNLRILCEKYREHDLPLHLMFIDYKKAFDRVWQEALWNSMRFYNIGNKLTNMIEALYNNARSAVVTQDGIGEWFRTTVGVRQGCLLSPVLFNIFLERIMQDTLENTTATVKIGGRSVDNLRFADDIALISGSQNELQKLSDGLNTNSTRFGMEISIEKTKTMCITTNKSPPIQMNGQPLEEVDTFSYLGAIINKEGGSQKEISGRIAKTCAALKKHDRLWRNKCISTKCKIKFLRALVISVLLYGCESWSITNAIEKRICSIEMKCYRRLLNISYKDHVTNDTVKQKIFGHIGPHMDLISIVKTRKLKWFGHVTRSQSLNLANTITHGAVDGVRKSGRPKKSWLQNIKEWTKQSLASATSDARNRDVWRTRSVMSTTTAPRRSLRSRDR